MSSPNGFQNVVNREPGVGQAGDFADANIKANVLAGGAAFVSAAFPRSPIIGNFAWGQQNDQAGDTSNKALGQYRGEAGLRIGFVHRENNTVLTEFLALAQQLIPEGREVTLFDQGSFWGRFVAGATVGHKVFASFVDGSLSSAPAGTSTLDATITASHAFVGGVGILTVTATSGTLKVGDVISAADGSIEGVQITAFKTGTGGNGTYYTTSDVTFSSTASLTARSLVETDFSVDTPALSGELAKISTWG